MCVKVSKYVIAWPQNHRSIEWLYYARIRHETQPHAEAYAAPSGTSVIMRSALLAEAFVFENRDDALKTLNTNIGYDTTAQIIEPTEEDWERAKKELFSQKLGNTSGISS